jgi:hypothetical protein
VLLDSRRERLGDTVVVTPVVVEAWTSVMAGMTGVVSFRTTAPMPRTLCAVVHVPFAEVDVVVGAHTASSCAREPYASLGRGGSMPRGSGAPMLTSQGSGEAEIVR